MKTIKITLTALLICNLVYQPLTAKILPIIAIDKPAGQTVEQAAPVYNKQTPQLLIQAKNLQFLSQVIAKDYFYINQLVHEDKATIEIERSLEDITTAFNILYSSIKDEEVKNLLTYLIDIRKDCNTLLDMAYSKENGTEILDYSEAMFEGAQLIIEHLQSKNNINEDEMYDVVFQQKLILQRISKYYIAFQAGFNDPLIISQLKKSIQQFEQGVSAISDHEYTDELIPEVTRIKKYWSLSKKYYLGMEQGDLTLVIYISTDHLMTSLDMLLDTHT